MKKLLLLTFLLPAIAASSSPCPLLSGGFANCSQRHLSSIPYNLSHYITGLDVSYNPLFQGLDEPPLPYPYLLDLNLSYCRLSQLSYLLFILINELQTLDLSGNFFQHVNQFEAYELLLFLPQLRILKVAYNPLKSFPSLFSQSLQELDLSGCEIPSVVMENGWLPNLHRLKLGENPIISLKSLKAPSLEELDLSGSKLINLSLEFLSTLQLLNHLIINRSTYLYSFVGLSPNVSIKILQADHCSFSYLQQLSWMPQLTELRMRHNMISSLQYMDLAGNRFLKIVDLADNSISHVDVNTFKGTPELKVLDLSDNRLSDITWAVHLLVLTSLNISGNSIRRIDDLQFTTELTILNASRCEINVLPSSILVLPYLTHLYLSRNLLTTLPRMEGKELRVIDLSYNRLLRLDNPWHTWKLQSLYLVGNRLTDAPSKIITSQLASTNLYLRDNPWFCICSSPEFTAFAASVRASGDSSLIQCHGPSNVSGLPWAAACATINTSVSSSSRHTWLPVLMGSISCLLVIAILLAIRSRLLTFPPPVEHTEPTPSSVTIPSFPVSPQQDSTLPSYEEALLLPKPPVSVHVNTQTNILPIGLRTPIPCQRETINRSVSSNSF